MQKHVMTTTLLMAAALASVGLWAATSRLQARRMEAKV